MGLKQSYTLFAPIYDLLIAAASEAVRAENLKSLHDPDPQGLEVLIAGIGSGLDIPHLPAGHLYTGIDLTPAMLDRARLRAAGRNDIELHEGDVMALPYADEQFDIVVMHLILAVVPQPQQALREASRVLRPGGRILLLDKFLRPGARAPLRRTLNLFSRHIATRTDVVFEEVLKCCPGLNVQSDQAALLGGWFRRLELRKEEPPVTP
ncbi:MAG: class I SAM-dependent methyltransferase [Gammaproteobacteria bacterium]|nr:class I SAM-dependent methyltransferase [Gammaproteobacteria bacterium]